MNLQNKKNYLSKLIGVIAIVMTLSVIFPSMSHFFTGQSSSNVAHAQPGEGYTGDAKTEEEAKKQAKEDDKKEKDKKDSGDDKSSKDDKDKKDDSEDSEDSEDSDKDKEESSDDGDGGGKGKGKNMPVDKYSVMYAQIIMGPAIDQQSAEKEAKKDASSEDLAWYDWKGKAEKKIKDEVGNAVSGIIGDGGVSLDVNYSEMSYLNKQIMGKNTSKYAGGERGQALASTFNTFYQYGYIKTVSGNSLVASGQDSIAGFGRLFGGIIAFIGLILFWAIRTLTAWVTSTLASVNPYHFVGFKQGAGVLPENPFSTAISKFFEGFGINGEVVTTIAELGLLIILFLLGWSVIAKLTRADFKGAGQAGKKWLIRLFVIFGAFPIMALTATAINKSVSEIGKANDFDSSPAMSHLLDERAWASGTNLSPSGLNGTSHPESSAKEDYLDKSYVPSSNKGRNLIRQINEVGYENLYGETDPTKISFMLLANWILNDNFNVNTYMGDLRAGKPDGGDLPGMSNFREVYAKHKKIEPNAISKTQLKSAIWSSTQNVSEKTKDVTNDNFNPSLEIGTENDQAFSTQSVALMLQSSFDDTSAKFYAYNFAPSGLQGNLKNLMTVKTEWKQMTLPGEGTVGVFGSWLSLIAESVAYILIASAVILTLITTNMFAAMIAFFKQIIRALTFGSINSAMATFLIYLGGITSVLISIGLPGVFIKLIQSIGDGIKLATQDIVPTGFVDILTAIMMMFFAWYLSYGAKLQGTGLTPVRLITSLPVKMAMDFEARVAELDKNGNTDLKSMASGMSESYGEHAKGASSAISNRMGGDARGVGYSMKNMANAGANGFKGGIVNTAKGSAVSGAKGAVAGLATGGLVGAGLGAGKGALAGGAKSAMNSAKNTASDMKRAGSEGMKAGRNGAQGYGQNKMAMAGIKQDRKDKDKANRESYGAKDALRDYSNERGKHLAGSEVAGAKESAMKYGNMPFGIMPNKRLSEQTTADKDHINKMTNESDLYADNSASDMRKFSAVAGMSAKEAVDEYNKPMFSKDEYRKLSNSENEDEFVDNLRDTNRGMEYAMNSTSAKTQLQDSRFTDDVGNISMDEINDFNRDIDRKFASGTMSSKDWQDKSKLDNAFVLGAQEKYRRPNSKFNKGKTFSEEDIEGAKKTSVKSASGVNSAGRGYNNSRPKGSSMNQRSQAMGSTGTPTRGAKQSANEQRKSTNAQRQSTNTQRQSTQNKRKNSRVNVEKAQKQQETRIQKQQEQQKKQSENMMKEQRKRHEEGSKRNKRRFEAMEKEQQRKEDQMMKEQKREAEKRRKRMAQQQQRNKRGKVKRLNVNDIRDNRKR